MKIIYCFIFSVIVAFQIHTMENSLQIKRSQVELQKMAIDALRNEDIPALENCLAQEFDVNSTGYTRPLSYTSPFSRNNNQQGQTILHLLCESLVDNPWNIQGLKWLLAHGANPNAQDKIHDTPDLLIIKNIFKTDFNENIIIKGLKLLHEYKTEFNIPKIFFWLDGYDYRLLQKKLKIVEYVLLHIAVKHPLFQKNLKQILYHFYDYKSVKMLKILFEHMGPHNKDLLIPYTHIYDKELSSLTSHYLDIAKAFENKTLYSSLLPKEIQKMLLNYGVRAWSPRDARFATRVKCTII